jgi:hypothetical protein
VKFLLAAIAAFLISFVWGFLVHGILLHGDYAQLPNLFRPDAEAMGYLPYMMLSHAVKGFAFAWVYRQGISPGVPWLSQGIRFGIIASLLITIPFYLVYFAVQPMPATLVVKQMALDTVGTMLMALAVAYILKPAATDM